jgi:outer membrane protein assembly factor BamB
MKIDPGATPRTTLRTCNSRRKLIGAALAVSALVLAGCGGGGGGGGNAGGASVQPYIVAAVLAFPANGAPPGFIADGSTSTGVAQIFNQKTGAPIGNATVRMNGVTLTYYDADQEYVAPLHVLPGDAISVDVTLNGARYSASSRMYSAYPTIIAPAPDTTWAVQDTNLISWSGAAPTGSSSYAIGVMDTLGNFVWPADGNFQLLNTSQTSFSVPAGGLTTTGLRFVLVGLIDVLGLPGAAPGSGFLVGGFGYAPVQVDSRPSATLVSLALQPSAVTVAPAKSKQLTLTGTYSDGAQQDLTATADWSSSDTSKVIVTSTGLVTGVAAGSATITAQAGGLTATRSVSVFQPTPSPQPPLSQSVTFQIDYAHSGRATVGSTGPTFPPSATWSRALNGTVSYPIIAGGKVFVTTGTNATDPHAYGTSLYALDLATGAVAWGPITIPGTYFFSGAAYDQGRLFVANFDGVVRAFDPATGTLLWTTTVGYFITTPPTAANGVLYLGGMLALDETTGAVLWTAYTGSGKNSPTVTSDGVFVSVPCNVFKLDPLVGTALWHYAGPCSGGGGKTAPYSNGKLYTRDYASSPQNQIFDAADGTRLGTFTAATIPAFSERAGFFLSVDIATNVTTLTAVDQASKDTMWTFQGDGNLTTPPIVIDGVVVIASSSGAVYALNASSGSVVWSGNTGMPISGADEQNANQLTGLGAGEGWLVVPAGSTVVAWKVVP